MGERSQLKDCLRKYCKILKFYHTYRWLLFFCSNLCYNSEIIYVFPTKNSKNYYECFLGDDDFVRFSFRILLILKQIPRKHMNKMSSICFTPIKIIKPSVKWWEKSESLPQNLWLYSQIAVFENPKWSCVFVLVQCWIPTALNPGG